MSRTITATYTSGISLNFSTDNPVSVTATGKVTSPGSYAISGVGVGPWTLTNSGVLAATGSRSDGVFLSASAGGTVVNNSTLAPISGTLYGVDIEGGTGRVVNTGTISGSGAYANGAGVQLLSGGTVTNGAPGTTTALITGGQSGAIYSNGGASDLVVNFGTILGLGSVGLGVQLRSGGTVLNGSLNDTVASIISPHDGIGVASGTATIVNDGTINGHYLVHNVYDYGVYLAQGGSVTNGELGITTALIRSNNFGVRIMSGAGGVTNRGTISVYSYGGGPNYAVRIAGTGNVVNDGMITSSGGVVRLDVGGSVTNDATGTMVGGFNAISTTGGPVSVLNQGKITADYGVIMSGGDATVINAGTITGRNGPAVDFINGGFQSRLIVTPGASFVGGVKGSNSTTLELASAATAGVVSGVGSTFTGFGVISIDPGAQWFISGNTAGLSGPIGGFTLGDTIEVTGITTIGSSFSAGTLTLDEGSGSSATLHLTSLPPSLTAADFEVTNVPGGTDVSLIVPCFVSGTRIRTERGPVAVEALLVGDRVPVVLCGEAQPIVWLGHRHVDCKRHPEPKQVWPVCLSGGAFGPGRPFRDLWLSPDHAVFINGVLIPIRYLVNGRTIRQEPRDEVTYWHIELAKHDVLYAEGVPAESYLDTGNRSAFANGGAVMDLHPDFARHIWETGACAPLVLDGSQLAAAKCRLLARANAVGHTTTDDPLLSVLTNGRTQTAARDGATWRVRLPKTTRNVRLVSRTWIPAHTQADTDDLRTLGVAISRLWLDQCEVELDSQVFSSGWHAREEDWRWSDGDAQLAPGGAREVAFEVGITGTYWQEEKCGAARAA